jgi:hypothetical protein
MKKAINMYNKILIFLTLKHVQVNICLSLSIISFNSLSIGTCFADWIDVACTIDRAMGYYPENEGLIPSSNQNEMLDDVIDKEEPFSGNPSTKDSANQEELTMADNAEPSVSTPSKSTIMPDEALLPVDGNNEDEITMIKVHVMDLVLLSEEQLSLSAIIKTLPEVTDSIYLLPNGVRYADTYEYQLLDAEVRETKSKDLLNILATIMTNYLIHNEYLDRNPKDLVGLQNHMIMKAIEMYSSQYGL